MSRAGRPRLDPTSQDPSADVHVTLAAKDYDRIAKLAKVREETVQDVIRFSLKRFLKTENVRIP